MNELDKVHSQINEAIALIDDVLDVKKVRFCKKMRAKLYNAALKLDDASAAIEFEIK